MPCASSRRIIRSTPSLLLIGAGPERPAAAPGAPASAGALANMLALRLGPRAATTNDDIPFPAMPSPAGFPDADDLAGITTAFLGGLTGDASPTTTGAASASSGSTGPEGGSLGEPGRF